MAQSELKVEVRQGTGKGAARSLRRQGMVPAVVYGKGLEPCSIALVPKELKQAIATEAGWNTLITLTGEGPFGGRTVILKDLQVSAIRREIQHADFQVIDRATKVQVMVPVHAVGKSEGEKAGGNLQVIRHELAVVCFPDAIPSAIEVDVTALGIGDVVHIADLVLPAGVEAPHDVNFTVITVTGRKGEEAAGTEETEA
ncbi:MAG: 50S ribosomal protein L25/general stress protein Ctc [Desulfuromonadales bacterium]|nr:50S ribosomal protein L25/general stress protein Ctc [Desulfuromonadales bacterium]